MDSPSRWLRGVNHGATFTAAPHSKRSAVRAEDPAQGHKPDQGRNEVRYHQDRKLHTPAGVRIEVL